MSPFENEQIKTVDNQHPYLGLDSYTEENKEYFYGRSEEVQKLYSLVKNNVVTVFFGSSGLGKTSLLKAGLFPKLRESYYLPIYIRLNFNDRSNSPIEQTKFEISKQINKIDKDVKAVKGLSLWEYFHQIEILNGLIKPVLVFDQFEEIFTVGRENISQITEFISELTDLIENQVPVSVQKKYKDKEISFAFQEQQYRIIISLREDYLPQLEKLNELMPSIKKSRFRVLAMGRDQAYMAITKPGEDIIDGHEANQILNLIVSVTYPDENGEQQDYEFEPFLLSFICEQINNLRLSKGLDKITNTIIQNIKIEDIIRKHYLENTNNLEKFIIEEHLLTIDGYRNFQFLNDIYKTYNITSRQIEALINHRIIRQVTRNKTVYIELIHDVLVPVVKESRDERKEKEHREREALAIEENIKKQKQKFIRKLAYVGFAITIIASVLFWVFLNRKAKLNLALTIAESSRSYYLEAKILNPTIGVRLAEAAYDEFSKDIRIKNNLISAFNSGPFHNILLDAKNTIESIELSNNYETLFVYYIDHKSSLYRIDGDELLKTQFDTTLTIDHAEFSESGDHILTLSPDSVIRIWNMRGECISKYLGFRNAKFSPDGKYVLTVADCSTAKLWNWNNNTSVLLEQNESIDLVGFIPSGRKIFTLSRNLIMIWDTSGNRLSKEENPVGVIDKIEFSGSGNWVITIKKGVVYLWSFLNGRLVTPVLLNLPDENIKIAKFTPDSRAILLLPESGKIMKLCAIEDIKQHNDSKAGTGRLYQKIKEAFPITKKKVVYFKGHTEQVNTLDFSDDGFYIITASNDKTARIWDIMGNEINVLQGHEDPVISAHFLGNYSQVLTSSWDNTLRLWDLERFNPLKPAEIKEKTTRRMNFICDNTIKTIYLINNNKDTTHTLRGHQFVTSVYASDNEQLILTSRLNNASILWNSNGDSIKRIWHPEGKLMSVDFSGNSKFMLLLFLGNKFNLFDTKKGNELKEFTIKGQQIIESWFSSDDYIYIKYSNGKVVEIPIDPGIIKDILIEKKEKSYIWKLDDKTKDAFGIAK